MIGTWTVVGIRHLTHNQVVAGSSPAGPRSLTTTPIGELIEVVDPIGLSTFYEYDLAAEREVLEPFLVLP